MVPLEKLENEMPLKQKVFFKGDFNPIKCEKVFIIYLSLDFN